MSKEDHSAGLGTGATIEPVVRPRRDMPQIRADQIDLFLQALALDGIKVEAGNVLVEALDPSQDELVLPKLSSKERGLASGLMPVKPFIVSKEGFIIDGHHQLAALKKVKPGTSVPVHLVDLPLVHLLELAKSFQLRHSLERKPNAVPQPTSPQSESQRPSSPRSIRKFL